MKRTRLDDVAREAGVSKSIASRVLNGYDLPVRPETRDRVFEAAERLKYRPHAGARALKREETRAIGMLVPDLTNAAYARIVRGTFARAEECDFAVLLAEDQGDAASEERLADLVRSGRIDGLLVLSARTTGTIVDVLRRSAIPHVFLNRAVEGSGRNVVLGSQSASDAAVAYLADLGHRRVGHVGGPRGVESAKRRAEAFRRAARRHRFEAAPIARGMFTEQGGDEVAHKLLRANPDITAIYASSIGQGIGTIHAAWRLGLTVPDDLAVIAYDDLPLANYTVPPLTTIRVPLERLGAAGLDALAAQLAGEKPGDIVIPVEPDVVIRASTAPPATAAGRHNHHRKPRG